MTWRGAGCVGCNDWFYESKSRANILSLKTGNSRRRHPGYLQFYYFIRQTLHESLSDLMQKLIKKNQCSRLNVPCCFSRAKVSKVLSEARRPTAISVYPKGHTVRRVPGNQSRPQVVLMLSFESAAMEKSATPASLMDHGSWRGCFPLLLGG
jgi:hypothetical protein